MSVKAATKKEVPQFQCGDTVQLRSGGPKMTVACLEMSEFLFGQPADESPIHPIWCEWFDVNNQVHMAKFWPGQLIRLIEPRVDSTIVHHLTVDYVNCSAKCQCGWEVTPIRMDSVDARYGAHLDSVSGKPPEPEHARVELDLVQCKCGWWASGWGSEESLKKHLEDMNR